MVISNVYVEGRKIVQYLEMEINGKRPVGRPGSTADSDFEKKNP